MKIAVNFISFQIGWFSCVLMAANNTPEIGVIITLLLVLLHLFISNRKVNTLALIFLVTVIGSTWDSVLTQQNILVYTSGVLVEYMAPIWIISIWLIFATTLTVTFKWLYGKYWSAMVLGAIFGPLAYLGGSELGAVMIPDMLTAMLALSIGWALLMPLLIWMAEYFQDNVFINGKRNESI